MGDSVFVVIPTDPWSVPDAEHEAAARAVVETLLPVQNAVETCSRGRVELIDAGANFESVHCPACATVLEMSWWIEKVDSAETDDGSGSLDVVPSCCGVATSLNDLHYHWPQGFASWSAWRSLSQI